MYNTYLQEKTKLHMAKSVYTSCENLASVTNMKKDRERGGEEFTELWGDDEEPAPALRPEWMADAVKIR